jgi:hypothetical protein
MFPNIVLYYSAKSIGRLAYHYIAQSNIVAAILFIGHATPNSHQQTKSNRGEVIQGLDRYRALLPISGKTAITILCPPISPNE